MYCWDDHAEEAGLKKNQKRALELLTRAAEQGHARAQYNLGICFSNGQGTQCDLQKAANWLQKAADQGVANAQSALGQMQPPKKEKVRAAGAEHLRFDIGETVKCNLGKWTPGIVVQHNYREEGMAGAYQVQLYNGALICAPRDDDYCIRLNHTLTASPEEKEKKGSLHRMLETAADMIVAAAQGFGPAQEFLMTMYPEGEEPLPEEETNTDSPPKQQKVGPKTNKEKGGSKKEEARAAGAEHLRFDIGERVECRMASWFPGIVVQHNYREEGMAGAYQVQLDSGHLICAPCDEDGCIRLLKTTPASAAAAVVATGPVGSSSSSDAVVRAHHLAELKANEEHDTFFSQNKNKNKNKKKNKNKNKNKKQGGSKKR
jgi:aromatic ring-cleaving dioxygenase